MEARKGWFVYALGRFFFFKRLCHKNRLPTHIRSCMIQLSSRRPVNEWKTVFPTTLFQSCLFPSNVMVLTRFLVVSTLCETVYQIFKVSARGMSQIPRKRTLKKSLPFGAKWIVFHLVALFSVIFGDLVTKNIQLQSSKNAQSSIKL